MALDSDDTDSLGIASCDERVIVSREAREDSLGEKYNRCQRLHTADLYVLGCDDTAITTPGWDKALLSAADRLPDHYGVVLFGDIPGVALPGLAVTHALVEEMGFLCAPYFPFWWHDTWIYEVGIMIGSIVKTNVDLEPIGEIKSSRGVREVKFWAKVFDDLRPQRRAAAERIVRKRLDRLMGEFEASNSVLRGERADVIEREFSFDAPQNDRYLRLKYAAEHREVLHGCDALDERAV